MIKLYVINRSTSSPFTDCFSEQYLKSKGITYTDNLLSADVIVTTSSELRKYKLLKEILFLKKFIVWTNEPRFNTVYEKFKSEKELIMNVYSGNVFLHNLHFLGSYHYDFSNNLGINLQSFRAVELTINKINNKKKFCAAVFSYRNPENSKIYINNKNVDLNAHRQNLACFLYKSQKADIIGNNWPEHIRVRESSGYESGNNKWWDTKINLLSEYRFNICFENTTFPYYCTEKIWHSIASGCLPIYYSEGTNIYETFPDDSFIDASKFSSNEDLLLFLENISFGEHVNRYNICLEVMHDSCNKRIKDPNLKTDVIDEYINNIYSWL